MSDHYFWPEGAEGIGADIGWCERHKGGKFCLLCGHHAKFKEWSQKWHWYYLVNWYHDDYGWYRKYGNPPLKIPYCYSKANWQYYRNWKQTGKKSWGSYGKFLDQPEPKRYSSRGLSTNDLRALLKKGCRKNKKCRCISIVQRGNWHCPKCYKIVHLFANYRGVHPHEVMITDRAELKKELLVLRLSGVL